MFRENVWADELTYPCPKCGGIREYTVWNTEKGYDEGFHCLDCDVYFPNIEARRSSQFKEREDNLRAQSPKKDKT
jgi:hypothetical protein